MELLQKIKFIDTFGVPVQVTFNQDRQFRTKLGAAVSVIIYALSLIYAVYVFEEWINWKILPKVQTQVRTLKEAAVSLGDGDISIGQFNNTATDPFSKTDNILTPVLMKLNNTNLEFVGAYYSQLRNVSYAEEQMPTVSFPGMSLSLTKDDIYRAGYNNEISYLIMILICSEKNLLVNATCATSEKIQDFLNNSASQMDFNINLKQYNTQTQQFDTIQKSLYFSIQTQNRLFGQMALKTTDYILDQGILLTDYIHYTYIDDINIMTEYQTEDFQKRFSRQNTLMQFYIKLDQLQTMQSVSYSKLGEILAQIGSIAQLLLLVKYALFFFNTNQLVSHIIEDIIQYQYPELNNLKIEKNIFGQVIKVNRDDLFYQPSDYRKFINQASLHILEKMDLNHIIKEIISIQTFIQTTFNINTSVPGRYDKEKQELSRSQIAKIFPSSEDQELNGQTPKLKIDEIA